jgi:acylphosphatase
MTMARLHLLIRGDVQGVFFRANTKGKADELGVTGWVRNCEDGSVECVAEGEKEKLERLLEWCKKGPSGANVSGVDEKSEEFKGNFKRFSIRYF